MRDVPVFLSGFCISARIKFLANFLIGGETGFALNGAVNIHNVLMHAPANQPYKFYCNVTDSRRKLTI